MQPAQRLSIRELLLARCALEQALRVSREEQWTLSVAVASGPGVDAAGVGHVVHAGVATANHA